MKGQKGSADNFTGSTFIEPITASEDGKFTVLVVYFKKGARTFWHKHGGEQVLYFLEGKGKVKIESQKPIDAESGDIVKIPAKARHWHGAHPTEANQMCHMAINNGSITWLEPVTDSEYRDE